MIGKISNGMVSCFLRFCIVDSRGCLVACSFFERSKAAVVSLSSSLMVEGANHRDTLYVNAENGKSLRAIVPRDGSYEAAYTNFFFDRDRANLAMVYSGQIGERYLLTKKEWLEHDLYNYLMNRYTLPLLEEWIPYILKMLCGEGSNAFTYQSNFLAEPGVTLNLKGEEIPVEEVMLLTINLAEDRLNAIITTGLQKGLIKICSKPQRPLDFGESGKSLDAYMTRYGSYLQDNVEKQVHPLTALNSKVEGLVTKSMRPYPQQAAVVEGIIALRRKGEKYGFLNCGMGCGKTIMGIGVVEGYHNQNWLLKHPGKSLKDMYMGDLKDQPKYRVIVMPPGHLVEKWQREILREVPGAKATILNDLSQLVELRARGREPEGREWYILSKDFCKLGSGESPIPANVGYQFIEADYCRTCYDETGDIVYKLIDSRGRGRCPKCDESKKFAKTPLIQYGKQSGLVCPNCNKLLLHPGAVTKLTGLGAEDDEVKKFLLQPEDFSSKKSSNAFCAQCGTPLWGANCKPVGTTPHRPAWYKVSHFSNWSKKNRKSAWVLRGKEYKYYLEAGLVDGMTGKVYPEMDVKASVAEYSPRKVAPANFIKKYLKGYFDFCILDECHKYAGAGTAQSRAAHALVQVSNFTMGLTGTLTNGKADSIYYLLWMLDPRKMVEKGFTYGSPMEFSKCYGCVEAVFEEGYSGGYGTLSKGRQITPPRTKPGINPLVYSEFLLDHAVNMDLSDMTKYMPPLKEYVEVMDLPSDVKGAYNRAAKILSDESKKKEGACLMGETLNFCLSFPDKPYGRKPIMHPKRKDALVMNPPECLNYKNNLLPKEQRIVDIIREEMEEGRNVFVFANFTGKEESNVTGRLQAIIERECSLSGRVDILRADTPEALKREAYIHARAKAGVQVVITNAKVCETGLDFCFEEDGVFYNYPTIIFAQPTYELATMMQASRRHYRLNQTVECRTYWMAYADTLQAAALQIMASKQVAAAAIQGKFSAEGLASMAQGVDPRIMLAKKLSEGDNSSREELNGMFDVLARNNAGDDEEDVTYEPPMLYFELMGEDYTDEVSTGIALPAIFAAVQKVVTTTTVPEIPSVVPLVPKKKGTVSGQLSLLSDDLVVIKDTTIIPFTGVVKVKKTKLAAGQLSLF